MMRVGDGVGAEDTTTFVLARKMHANALLFLYTLTLGNLTFARVHLGSPAAAVTLTLSQMGTLSTH